MAVSNRDRIGKLFDQISPELDDFISSIIGKQNPELGASWAELVRVHDENKHGPSNRDYDPSDVQIQFRVLSEPKITESLPGVSNDFFAVLAHTGRSYVSELRNARNDWAHGKPFNADDAYRVIDTAERLLTLINKTEPVPQLSEMRRELRRVSVDRDDNQVFKKAAATNPESDGLRPWREVLLPHPDVATGNFQAAEFAADLYQVSQNPTGGDEYSDPMEFFRRTYLTDGLRALIGKTVNRLRGDSNASPVINLQTNFGGGKTHSMLSLWHLAGNTHLEEYPQEMQELLAEHHFDELRDQEIRRVAIVGNHFAPTGETKPDGTFVRTLWGELAWQLGGNDGYAMVAEADKASTVPGDTLHRLLTKYSPAVILIDEWVAYARALYGTSPGDNSGVTGGSFESQFTFAQALTEAVKTTPGTLLAISIPASETQGEAEDANFVEVGGAHGVQAVKMLQNVVRRVADQWRPASATEAYHIVRQRLFSDVDARSLAEISKTAGAFVNLYRAQSAEFPSESRVTEYEDRIKHSYPIHPELFDRLYEDWSSLERFQRTRGVLRFMNAVVHALWKGNDSSPLIMPGSLPLSTAAVNAEITNYLPDSWKAVIDSDVDGTNSEPARIDAERPQFGQRAVTQRLARTVFFGSVPTKGTAHYGIEMKRVALGTAMPGDRVSDFHSALNVLGEKATYYYSAHGNHWYDLAANINRTARDKAEQFSEEDVHKEIRRRITELARPEGPFRGVHVAPNDSGDVADIDETRLVILGPSHPHQQHRGQVLNSEAVDIANEILRNHGASLRKFRNMLVFLAPDRNQLQDLDSSVRQFLGWKQVLTGVEPDLTSSQRTQAEEQVSRANETVRIRLRATYRWVIHPKQAEPQGSEELIETKVESESASLINRVGVKLGRDGDIAETQSMEIIRHALNRVPVVWEPGHVKAGDLWEIYARYTYMPRLKNAGVLYDNLTSMSSVTWSISGYALAEDFDSASGRYINLWTPEISQSIRPNASWYLVKPEVALSQIEREKTEPIAKCKEDPASREQAPASFDSSDLAPKQSHNDSQQNHANKHETRMPNRYYGRIVLPTSTTEQILDYGAVLDEVVAHLQQLGSKVILSVEIEATNSNGFSEQISNVVKENSTTLGFEVSEFSDDQE